MKKNEDEESVDDEESSLRSGTRGEQKVAYPHF